MDAGSPKEPCPLHLSVQIASFHLPLLYSITPYISHMTSRNLICPPLSWQHAARHNRDASSSISGQSSSSGIHQVLPTSHIHTPACFLTLQFLPERNLPWHARLLESLSLSFPIILIRLWWSLILLYRRQQCEIYSFLYVICRMCLDTFSHAGQKFHSHPVVLFSFFLPCCLLPHRKKTACHMMCINN